MNGQINLETNFGQIINKISSLEENKIFLEIGTWNGQGSTYCVMESLLKRKEEQVKFYSLECNKSKYVEAVALWKSILKNNFNNGILNLLYGRIVEIEEIYKREELKSLDGFFNDWYKWYDEDINSFDECENVVNQIPDFIDVLILDGGEFSTFAEFNKLFPRIKNYIILDDCNVLKCKEVYKILKQNSDWSLVSENISDRNGYAIFKKVGNA
jgi:hypothetical protein